MPQSGGSHTSAAKPLSPAQQRVLLEAMRAHPAPLRKAHARVAEALQAAGLLLADGAALKLWPQVLDAAQCLDAAARLSAQRFIDAVNLRRSPPATKPSPPRRPARPG